MKMNVKVSSKHLQIDQAQSTMLLVVAIAAAVTVFCLISSKSLLSQGAYQHKVINARHEALKKLEANYNNAQTLVNQYNTVFEGSDPSNVIGGKNTKDENAAPPDGDNARIVLDALPSGFDFPALLTSLSKIMADARVNAPQVNGVDDPGLSVTSASAKPQPQAISLSASANGSYGSIVRLITDFERSIRPFDITNLTINGNARSMFVSMQMATYYQPSTSFAVETKEVK